MLALKRPGSLQETFRARSPEIAIEFYLPISAEVFKSRPASCLARRRQPLSPQHLASPATMLSRPR